MSIWNAFANLPHIPSGSVITPGSHPVSNATHPSSVSIANIGIGIAITFW